MCCLFVVGGRGCVLVCVVAGFVLSVCCCWLYAVSSCLWLLCVGCVCVLVCCLVRVVAVVWLCVARCALPFDLVIALCLACCVLFGL